MPPSTAAITAHLRATHCLEICKATAEKILAWIGTPASADQRMEVRGRDSATGLERHVVISSEEIRKE